MAWRGRAYERRSNGYSCHIAKKGRRRNINILWLKVSGGNDEN
jgi:hypothetical protein